MLLLNPSVGWYGRLKSYFRQKYPVKTKNLEDFWNSESGDWHWLTEKTHTHCQPESQSLASLRTFSQLLFSAGLIRGNCHFRLTCQQRGDYYRGNDYCAFNWTNYRDCLFYHRRQSAFITSLFPDSGYGSFIYRLNFFFGRLANRFKKASPQKFSLGLTPPYSTL